MIVFKRLNEHTYNILVLCTVNKIVLFLFKTILHYTAAVVRNDFGRQILNWNSVVLYF